MIKVYTDGACSPNPGKGGWGVYIQHPCGEVESLNGGRENTTNNQMELLAPIKALEHFEARENLTIYTDSQYVKKGITEWIHGWRRKGWRTANKKPVKNEDLWRDLDEQCKRHTVKWVWVRGHNGNSGNEEADRLAGIYVYGDRPVVKELTLTERIAQLEARVALLESSQPCT